MADFEDLLKMLAPMLVIVWLLPMFLGAYDSINEDRDNQTCELIEVECGPDDLVSDCTIQQEEIVTGPYWNETKELKITLVKEVCK